MWKIIAIVAVCVLIWFKFFRRVEKMTDESKITTIVSKVREVKPELIPIDTVSVDDNKARILFVNTKTYAGEMYDSTISEQGSVDIQPTIKSNGSVQETSITEAL